MTFLEYGFDTSKILKTFNQVLIYGANGVNGLNGGSNNNKKYTYPPAFCLGADRYYKAKRLDKADYESEKLMLLLVS